MSATSSPIDALPEALLRLAELDGTILEANGQARRLLGGEVVGRRIQDIDAGADAEAHWVQRLSG